MKEKLEAVTGGGSRKNSVKSTTSKKSEDSMEVGGDPVGKLEEKKKLLIEQKLGAGKKLLLRILAPQSLKTYGVSEKNITNNSNEVLFFYDNVIFK